MKGSEQVNSAYHSKAPFHPFLAFADVTERTGPGDGGKSEQNKQNKPGRMRDQWKKGLEQVDSAYCSEVPFHPFLVWADVAERTGPGDGGESEQNKQNKPERTLWRPMSPWPCIRISHTILSSFHFPLPFADHPNQSTIQSVYLLIRKLLSTSQIA